MYKAPFVIACSLLAACVVGDDTDGQELSTSASAIQSDNGRSLNGVSLNGVSLNGVSLNGVSLNGVSLNGVSLNGVSLNGVSLNGTAMTTVAVGSTWTAMLSNSQDLPMRIDSATTGTGADADIGMYSVSYHTSSGWQPLCGANPDGTPGLALAVAGTWNLDVGVAGGGQYTASTTQFTWACRAKTIAKCVELGYRPWEGRTTQLASCVRLLRADYCGDGSSNTVDGQQLNVYDNLGIQDDTLAWTAEAEWTPQGARCISEKKRTRFGQLKLKEPWCVKTHLVPHTETCADSFAAGAIMISEYAGAKYSGN